MITKRKMDQNSRKVLIGMSGGVDSSVAVALLQNQGFEVVGTTMLVLKESCRNNTVEKEAKEIAKQFGIEHISLHLQDSFDEKIIQTFISEYLKGRTPNPCVFCNRIVKFEELLKTAYSKDIPYIATGHYANIEKIGDRYVLKKGKSKTKDQSYVLYNLTQEQLAHTMFPLGQYEKTEVRELAKKYNLPTAEKKDSQEICFIKDDNYNRFIVENTESEMLPGDIVDTKGNILGKHTGVFNYTVGQRKGLGIPSNNPLYVLEIDIEKNQVVVGDDSETFSDRLVARDLNWISINNLENERRVEAKIRYGAKEAPATVRPLDDNRVEVVFDTPQRAITPGQAVVFYDGDYVIGGGVID